MTIFSWIVAVIALAGTVLNARQRKEGFVLWIISNSFFCWFNFCIGSYAQSCLMAVYTALAIYGLIQWQKNDN